MLLATGYIDITNNTTINFPTSYNTENHKFVYVYIATHGISLYGMLMRPGSRLLCPIDIVSPYTNVEWLVLTDITSSSAKIYTPHNFNGALIIYGIR
jgi:hypothetical protein